MAARTVFLSSPHALRLISLIIVFFLSTPLSAWHVGNPLGRPSQECKKLYELRADEEWRKNLFQFSNNSQKQIAKLESAVKTPLLGDLTKGVKENPKSEFQFNIYLANLQSSLKECGHNELLPGSLTGVFNSLVNDKDTEIEEAMALMPLALLEQRLAGVQNRKLKDALSQQIQDLLEKGPHKAQPIADLEKSILALHEKLADFKKQKLPPEEAGKKLSEDEKILYELLLGKIKIGTDKIGVLEMIAGADLAYYYRNLLHDGPYKSSNYATRPQDQARNFFTDLPDRIKNSKGSERTSSHLQGLREALTQAVQEPGTEDSNDKLAQAFQKMQEASPEEREAIRDWAKRRLTDLKEGKVVPSKDFRDLYSAKNLLENLALRLDSHARQGLDNYLLKGEQDPKNYASLLNKESEIDKSLSEDEKKDLKTLADFLSQFNTGLPSASRMAIVGKGNEIGMPVHGLSRPERKLLAALTQTPGINRSRELGDQILQADGSGIAAIALENEEGRKTLQKVAAGILHERGMKPPVEIEKLHAAPAADRSATRKWIYDQLLHGKKLGGDERQALALVLHSLDHHGHASETIQRVQAEGGLTSLDAPSVINQVNEVARLEEQADSQHKEALARARKYLLANGDKELPLASAIALLKMPEDDLFLLMDLMDTLPKESAEAKKVLVDMILSPNSRSVALAPYLARQMEVNPSALETNIALYSQHARPDYYAYVKGYQNARVMDRLESELMNRGKISPEADNALKEIAAKNVLGRQNPNAPMTDADRALAVEIEKEVLEEEARRRAAAAMLGSKDPKREGKAKTILADVGDPEEAFGSAQTDALLNNGVAQHLNKFLEANPLPKGSKILNRQLKEVADLEKEINWIDRKLAHERVGTDSQFRAEGRLLQSAKTDAERKSIEGRIADLEAEVEAADQKYGKLQDALTEKRNWLAQKHQSERLAEGQAQAAKYHDLAKKFVKENRSQFSRIPKEYDEQLIKMVQERLMAHNADREQMRDLSKALQVPSEERKSRDGAAPHHYKDLTSHMRDRMMREGGISAWSADKWKSEMTKDYREAISRYDRKEKERAPLLAELRKYGFDYDGANLHIAKARVADMDQKRLEAILDQLKLKDQFYAQVHQAYDHNGQSRSFGLNPQTAVEVVRVPTEEGQNELIAPVEFKFVNLTEKQKKLQKIANETNELFDAMTGIREKQNSSWEARAKNWHLWAHMGGDSDKVDFVLDPIGVQNKMANLSQGIGKKVGMLPEKNYGFAGARWENGIIKTHSDREMEAAEKKIAENMSRIGLEGGRLSFDLQGMQMNGEDLQAYFRNRWVMHNKERLNDIDIQKWNSYLTGAEDAVTVATAPFIAAKGVTAVGQLGWKGAMKKAAVHAWRGGPLKEGAGAWARGVHMFVNGSRRGLLITNANYLGSAAYNHGADISAPFVGNIGWGYQHAMNQAENKDAGHWDGNTWVTDDKLYIFKRGSNGEAEWTVQPNRTGKRGGNNQPDWMDHKNANKLMALHDDLKTAQSLDRNFNQIPDDAEGLNDGPLGMNQHFLNLLPNQKDWMKQNISSVATFGPAGIVGNWIRATGLPLTTAFDNVLAVCVNTFAHQNILPRVWGDPTPEQKQILVQCIKNAMYGAKYDDYAGVLYRRTVDGAAKMLGREGGNLLSKSARDKLGSLLAFEVNNEASGLGAVAEELWFGGYTPMVNDGMPSDGKKQSLWDIYKRGRAEGVFGDVMAGMASAPQSNAMYVRDAMKNGVDPKDLIAKGESRDVQLAMSELRAYELKPTIADERGRQVTNPKQEKMIEFIRQQYAPELRKRDFVAGLNDVLKEKTRFRERVHSVGDVIVPEARKRALINLHFEKGVPLEAILARATPAKEGQASSSQLPLNLQLKEKPAQELVKRFKVADVMTPSPQQNGTPGAALKPGPYKEVVDAVAESYGLPAQGFHNYLREKGLSTPARDGRDPRLEDLALAYKAYRRTHRADPYLYAPGFPSPAAPRVVTPTVPRYNEGSGSPTRIRQTGP